ncbi:MAG: electron transfer flavoprotein subunit beta/FixA family protein [Christensenellales bacterium]
MNLNIVVCIKPVPDPEHYDKITINPITKTITRQGIPTIINPDDKHALEAAIQLKEKHGGKVTVITMAPPNADETLREALAMGADEAYLLTDRAFAGADTLATSYTISQGIKEMGDFDIVLTGAESADGATSQVPAQLAEWLEIPHLWNVREFSLEDGKEIKVKTKIENGYMEYAIKYPALLAVARDINKPRYIKIINIMKAKNKPLTVLTKEDLDLDESYLGLKGSPTQPGGIFTPSMQRAGEELKGSTEEIVEQLIEKLKASGILSALNVNRKGE